MLSRSVACAATDQRICLAGLTARLQSRLRPIGGTVGKVLVSVRRRGATVVAIVATMSMVSTCATGSTSGSEVRAGAVYEGIIRWFAQRDDADPDPLAVFIEPRGEGASIELEVQTGLISSTADVAEVRFIDSLDEALITDSSGSRSVVDDGVLIRLAPVVERGSRIRLQVDVHEVDDNFEVLQLDLELVGERWVVAEPPVELTSG